MGTRYLTHGKKRTGVERTVRLIGGIEGAHVLLRFCRS